jgi:peptidoglycan/xylan/chitin deacetylase (PgdA/CDA1 family)
VIAGGVLSLGSPARDPAALVRAWLAGGLAAPVPAVIEAPATTLTFHCVGRPCRRLEPAEDAVWLPAGEFERILDTVGALPGVRLTFDGGNVTDAEIVAPQLLRRGLVGSFFVPASRIGTRGFLDAGALRDLAAAGMVVGSQGMRLRPWRGLAPAELDVEVRVAKERLEEACGRRVSTAACPFGWYDRRTLARLKLAGFERVFTNDRGTSAPRDWLQTRNTVRRTDRAEDLLRLVEARENPIEGVTRRMWRGLKQWR